MIQGKLKVLKGGMVAVYVSRKQAVIEEAPWNNWRPGFGFVEPIDSLVQSGDDAGLVCSTYCYDVTAIEKSRLKERLKDVPEGTVLPVKVGKGTVMLEVDAAGA